MSRSSGFVVGLMVVWVAMRATAVEPVEVSERLRAVAEQAAQVKVPEEIEERVRTLMERVESKEWQERQETYTARIQEGLGIDQVVGEEASSEKERQAGAVLFVSSSMPLETLRNYAADLEKVGGVMVLRGMIGGMKTIRPTAVFTADVLKRDLACTGGRCAMRGVELLVDPMLFRVHEIEQVPALIVEEDMDLRSYCQRSGEGLTPEKAARVVSGDASLRALLEEMSSMNGGARLAKELLGALGGGEEG